MDSPDAFARETEFDFAARTMGQTLNIGAGYLSGLHKMLAASGATSGPVLPPGEDVMPSPEHDAPFNIIECAEYVDDPMVADALAGRLLGDPARLTARPRGVFGQVLDV